MGSLISFTQTTKLVLRPAPRTLTTPHQFNLALDDVRVQAVTSTERQSALRSLVRLLLEAGGGAIQEEGSDDHA